MAVDKDDMDSGNTKRKRRSKWDMPAEESNNGSKNPTDRKKSRFSDRPIMESQRQPDAAQRAKERAAQLAAKLAAEGKINVSAPPPPPLMATPVSVPADHLKASTATPPIPSQVTSSQWKPEVMKLESGGYLAQFEINDLPARVVLTKGALQEQIHQQCGAAVSTKGKYMTPDEKAQARHYNSSEQPLYLSIQAPIAAKVEVALHKIQDIIKNYDKRPPSAAASAPLSVLLGESSYPPSGMHFVQDKVFVGLEHAASEFNVKSKIEGPGGSYLQHIVSQTGAKVYLRGKGSGYAEPTSGKESFESLYIYVNHAHRDGLEEAKKLCRSLIEKTQNDYSIWDQSRRNPSAPSKGYWMNSAAYPGQVTAYQQPPPYARPSQSYPAGGPQGYSNQPYRYGNPPPPGSHYAPPSINSLPNQGVPGPTGSLPNQALSYPQQVINPNVQHGLRPLHSQPLDQNMPTGSDQQQYGSLPRPLLPNPQGPSQVDGNAPSLSTNFPPYPNQAGPSANTWPRPENSRAANQDQGGLPSHPSNSSFYSATGNISGSSNHAQVQYQGNLDTRGSALATDRNVPFTPAPPTLPPGPPYSNAFQDPSTVRMPYGGPVGYPPTLPGYPPIPPPNQALPTCPPLIEQPGTMPHSTMPPSAAQPHQPVDYASPAGNQSSSGVPPIEMQLTAGDERERPQFQVEDRQLPSSSDPSNNSSSGQPRRRFKEDPSLTSVAKDSTGADVAKESTSHSLDSSTKFRSSPNISSDNSGQEPGIKVPDFLPPVDIPKKNIAKTARNSTAEFAPKKESSDGFKVPSLSIALKPKPGKSPLTSTKVKSGALSSLVSYGSGSDSEDSDQD